MKVIRLAGTAYLFVLTFAAVQLLFTPVATAGFFFPTPPTECTMDCESYYECEECAWDWKEDTCVPWCVGEYEEGPERYECFDDCNEVYDDYANYECPQHCPV